MLTLCCDRLQDPEFNPTYLKQPKLLLIQATAAITS